jgi:acetate kinase
LSRTPISPGFVGAFHLKLGANVDALVFAGGVGERSQELRHVVGNAVECLHYQPIDQEKNTNVHFDGAVNVVEIGAGGAEKGRVLVCQTDEQVGCSKLIVGTPLMFVLVRDGSRVCP